jgi:hypothetical protein
VPANAYGDGTFQPAQTFPVNGTGPYSIAVSNFNNDNAPDVVVSTQSGATSGTLGSAFVFLNTRGTSAAITCSPDLLQFGQNTTCTAKFTPTLSEMPVPSGNVAINISNAPFPVCGGSLDATGTVQCQGGSMLGMGGWGVKADYSGDKNYNPGSFFSATVLSVDQLNFPPGSLSSTVAAGETAQFTVSLSDNLGYTGSVSLTCTGAPPGAACSVPANVKLPVQITAMVSTTSRTMAAVPSSYLSSWWWTIGVAGLILLPGVRKQRSPRMARTLPLWFLVFLASCGGNSGSKPNPNGTPAGTYTMTLTAAAGGLKSSTPLILTVQ